MSVTVKFVCALVCSSIISIIGWYIFIHKGSQIQQTATNQQATEKKSSNPSIKIKLLGLNKTENISGIVALQIDTENDKEITKIEYLIDGEIIIITSTPPFDFKLDTTKLSNGTHTVIVKAYNQTGSIINSQEVTISVENKSPNQTAYRTRYLPQNTPTPTSLLTSITTSSSNSSSNNSSSSSNSSNNSSSGDTSAPTTPTNLSLSADDGYTVNLSWTASSDNTGVSGYKIFREGSQIATSTSASYQDQTVVPGNTYDYIISAYDAANNNSANSTESSITLATTSIWISGDTPQGFDNDASDYELGVKFRPLVDGKISGIRFYKGASNTGTHVGRLWTSSGTELANATFTSETSTGWQSVNFSSPIDVTAGTTYVGSYSAPNGNISFTSSYFASAGITSQYLRALASGVEGNNGVFNTTAGNFPSSSFSNTNYWVDVNFIPNLDAGGPTAKTTDNSKVYSDYPGSNNTGIPVGRRIPSRDRNIAVYIDGTTIENIELNAEINVNANNVTIKNTRITTPTGGLIWGIKQIAGKSGLVVQDTEIYGDGTNQLQYGILDDGSNITVQRANIYTISDGIQANVNGTITDTFIHDLKFFTNDHNDSFLMTGGNTMTLTHNTFHNPLNQTAALGLFCDFSEITNVTATNNLLIGGGYSVYGGGNGSSCTNSHDIQFINNKFSREVWSNGGFNGPVTGFNATQSGSLWTGNVWLDDGTTVSP